jgi:hypothetical protein
MVVLIFHLVSYKSRPAAMTGLFFCYIPMQLVAPSAVTIAVATDAIICTMNFIVSRLVMVLIFKFYHFYNFYIVQRVGA